MGMKVAVITDSNSGITQKQADSYGLHVLPMPVILDGHTFFEELDIGMDTFFEKLLADAELTTSQPSFGSVIDIWDRLLHDYDEIVHIPMSSGLSAACASAEMLAKDYNGRVQVVNNHRISVTLKHSVLDALKLAEGGRSAAEIKNYLEQVKYDCSIYIMVDTLKYLKKGGRITPAGAAIGSILNIKPVLQLQGEKLDSYARARGVKQARAIMIDAMKKDFSTRFNGVSDPGQMWLELAYTYDKQAALDFLSEVEQVFPGYELSVNPLSMSVSCHIGPGALAVACSRKLDTTLLN